MKNYTKLFVYSVIAGIGVTVGSLIVNKVYPDVYEATKKKIGKEYLRKENEESEQTTDCECIQ